MLPNKPAIAPAEPVARDQGDNQAENATDHGGDQGADDRKDQRVQEVSLPADAPEEIYRVEENLAHRLMKLGTSSL